MSRLVQTCPVCRLPGVRRRSLPTCRLPCKSFVKGEKDSPDARLGGARTIEAIRTRSSHVCLSAVVSCLRRTGHPCKSFVKGEKDSPDARLGGARTIEAIRTRSSRVCLSAVVSC